MNPPSGATADPGDTSTLLKSPSSSPREKENQKAPKASHSPNTEISNNTTVQETRKFF